MLFAVLTRQVKISSRLMRKSLSGTALTRRERRQLTRTTADLFRLIPMVVILVIPFMELALPLILKVFPNMLPSTYEVSKKQHPPAAQGPKYGDCRFADHPGGGWGSHKQHSVWLYRYINYIDWKSRQIECI